MLLKVVTDLICSCTYFFNLNVVLTGFLVNYRLSQELVTLPDLSCNIVSVKRNIKPSDYNFLSIFFNL